MEHLDLSTSEPPRQKLVDLFEKHKPSDAIIEKHDGSVRVRGIFFWAGRSSEWVALWRDGEMAEMTKIADGYF
ncbi:MAG: hypothetical protein VST64_11035, partial [Nitrospirota bacterium]|nr:hypothetical protein [Nitrospirota bacterium]